VAVIGCGGAGKSRLACRLGRKLDLDGSYLGRLERRLQAADTVVFLDLSAWRCAWRATWRVVRGRGSANTAAGCPERLDRRHLRFLLYIWRFPRNSRPRLLQRLAGREQPTIRRLATPTQVRRFVRELAP
jgi:adenylate kinase family enzyme